METKKEQTAFKEMQNQFWRAEIKKCQTPEQALATLENMQVWIKAGLFCKCDHSARSLQFMAREAATIQVCRKSGIVAV